MKRMYTVEFELPPSISELQEALSALKHDAGADAEVRFRAAVSLRIDGQSRIKSVIAERETPDGPTNTG